MRISNPAFQVCSNCKKSIVLGDKLHLFVKPTSDEPVQVCSMCLAKVEKKGWQPVVKEQDNHPTNSE